MGAQGRTGEVFVGLGEAPKDEGWWKWGVLVVVVGDGGCRTRHITVLKRCAELEACRMGWRHLMGGKCEDSTHG